MRFAFCCYRNTWDEVIYEEWRFFSSESLRLGSPRAMVQRVTKATVCRTARQELHGVSHRKCARSCVPLPPCKHTDAVAWVPSTWLPRILMTFQRCPTPPNTLHTGNSSQLLRTLDSVTTTAARCGFWGSYASHHVSCCLSVPSLSLWHVMAFPESFRKKKKMFMAAKRKQSVFAKP